MAESTVNFEWLSMKKDTFSARWSSYCTASTSILCNDAVLASKPQPFCVHKCNIMLGNVNKSFTLETILSCDVKGSRQRDCKPLSHF